MSLWTEVTTGLIIIEFENLHCECVCERKCMCQGEKEAERERERLVVSVCVRVCVCKREKGGDQKRYVVVQGGDCLYFFVVEFILRLFVIVAVIYNLNEKHPKLI